VDVMMPGLSGYDVCRRIRADPATALLPVVLVTSLDPHEERVKGIEAGADDFLQKPIHQAELLARVRSLLRIKALQDEGRLILAGLGFGALTVEGAKPFVQQKVLFQLPPYENLPVNEVYLVTPENLPLSDVERLFIDMLRAAAVAAVREKDFSP